MSTVLSVYNRIAGVLLPLTVALGCYMAATGLHDPSRPPAPSPSAISAASHAYAVQGLAGTYADAFDAAAKLVESGGSKADVWKLVQTQWQADRVAAFDRLASPAFKSALAADREFTDADRPDVASELRAFATGLRRVK